MKGPLFSLPILSLILALSITLNCSQVVRDDQIKEADFSKFVAPQDKSLVVFYIPVNRVRAIRILTIYDGNNPVINLIRYTKFIYVCAPGKHLFKAFSITNRLVDFMETELIGGYTYFVQVYPLYFKHKAGEVSGISVGTAFGGSSFGMVGGFGGSITTTDLSLSFIPQINADQHLDTLVLNLRRCEDRPDNTDIQGWTQKYASDIYLLDTQAHQAYYSQPEEFRKTLPPDSGVKFDSSTLARLDRLYREEREEKKAIDNRPSY